LKLFIEFGVDLCLFFILGKQDFYDYGINTLCIYYLGHL